MLWKRKKSKNSLKKEKESLALAKKLPVPRAPMRVTEVKPGIKEAESNFFDTPRAENAFDDRPPSKLPKGIAWAIAGLAAFFVAGFIISFFIAKHQIARSIATHSATMSAGIKDMQNFDPQDAELEFSSLSATSSGVGSFAETLGVIFQGSKAISSFSDLSQQLVRLPEEYEAVQSDLFSGAPLAFEGMNSASSSVQAPASTTFSADLVALQGTVDALDNDTDQMSPELGMLSQGSSTLFGGQNYLAIKSQLHSGREFLDEFVPWVTTSTPHHILVLLENSAELRPGGGFLGSYADVTIAHGTITGVDVHDVADVDAGFTENIVPPLPLQPEISRFRPADGNWFFDFPTSASQTLGLFEASNLYSGTGTSTTSTDSITNNQSPISSSTSFDGVIAVSPDVISDLLGVTGPVTIDVSSTPSGKSATTTFASSTALVQIQQLVQDGQAQSATYPKAVLKSLADAMFAQLASSTEVDQQGLLGLARNWVQKKDIMVYFNDPGFETFVTSYGAGGDVYQVPQNFNGDYLADVDANVDGGKSDLYVSSTVTWQSQINADGTIDDSVIIDRQHEGNTSPYWWYQVTNQDYLQLFVPDGSTLTNESGGQAKTIVPKVNYAKLGYAVDSTIATIESSTQPIFGYPAVTTHEEDGKEVFATWVTTKSGASSEVSFEYSHHAFSAPAAGIAYQFIFEKQASTARNYSFEFDAPLGYVFAENGLASYQYTSSNPPGRMIITLTLQKI